MKRAFMFGSIAVLVASSAASCAEAEEASTKNEAATASVPQPDASEASVDAGADVIEAGCDAADKGCVDHVISCADVPWCPVDTTVSSQYALTAVWGSGKNDVWTVGSGGTIAHWDGAAWKQTPPSPAGLLKNTFHAVWGSGPTDVYAVSMTDTMFHSNGFAAGTAEWTKVPAAGSTDEWPMTALAIWGTTADDVRVGARARMTFDPDTGEYTAIDQYTLKRVAADADAGTPATIAWDGVAGEGAVNAIWGSSATDLWIVADNSERNGWEKGLTRHGVAGQKGGFTWTSVDSQSTVVLRALWGSSKDDVWAVGDKGTIRRMKNGAQRWEIVASPTTENLRGVWGSSANDVWAVGDAGTILHFDGAAWKPSEAAFAIGLKPDLYGVWGSAANDVWIVGGNVALHYTGGGQ